MAKNWIGGAIRHPGALHKSLGVPQGQPISQAKLSKAAASPNPLMAKRAKLAETLKGFNGGEHQRENLSTDRGKFTIRSPMQPKGLK